MVIICHLYKWKLSIGTIIALLLLTKTCRYEKNHPDFYVLYSDTQL